MVYKSSAIASGSSGGTGGGGIQSINADTTPAQLIVSGAGINVSTTGGTTTITNTSAGSAGVSSVFGRTGVVAAQYGDYNFNLIAGTATASQGGTGLATLTPHAVLLGEGVSAVSFATTGTASRLLIDQGNADPAFFAITGDSSMTSTGVMVNTAVHGVTYPASPGTNTVPVVTGSNVVTYEAVPNTALANSAITIGAQTGLAGGGSVALGSAITLSMGTSAINTLAGYNSSGVFSDVAIGTGLSLSGGTLTSTASGSVTSVFGRTGAVTAQWNDYNFNLIGGVASVSQGGTGVQTLSAHGVLLGEGTANVSAATTGTAARILIDQGAADPSFQPVSGDVSMISTGAHTVLAVHGVTYPSSPSTGFVPVVTSSNVVTYELVPNASLANSSVTVNGVSGVTGGGAVALGSSITLGMADSSINSLAGYNASGVFSTITVGSNLTLSGGTLNATSSGGGGSGNASALTDVITQTSHGFSIGNVLKYTGTAYALAEADNASDAEVVGIVSSVSGANGFILTTSGYVTGLSAISAGQVYFLSAASAGILSLTDPAIGQIVGQVSKPLLIADTTSSGYFNNWRGEVVGQILPVNQAYRAINFSLDGAGSAIAPISGSNTWYLADVPYAGTITSWSLVADKSGGLDIDIWKTNAAVPTISNTITASAQCSLASSQAVFNGPITGWASAVSVGDCFAFNLISASSVTKANLTINVTAS